MVYTCAGKCKPKSVTSETLQEEIVIGVSVAYGMLDPTFSPDLFSAQPPTFHFRGRTPEGMRRVAAGLVRPGQHNPNRHLHPCTLTMNHFVNHLTHHPHHWVIQDLGL